MSKKVFFLLDYGSYFGYGHLSRCSNLAQYLQNKNYDIFLIISLNSSRLENDHVSKKWLNIYGSNIIVIKNIESNIKDDLIRKSTEINKIVKDSILIIDHYYLNKYLFYNVIDANSLIQFKDSINDSDLISLKNKKNKIIYFLPKELIPIKFRNKPNIFFGLDLFPTFPPEFTVTYPNNYSDSNLNILFTPGSSFNKLFESILKAINKLKNANKIQIYSPFSSNFESNNINFINGDNGLIDFLYFSDLIITAAGNTMLEGIYFDTPIFAYCTNSNQYSLANFLEKSNKINLIKKCEFINYENIVKYSIKKNQFISKNIKKVISHRKIFNIISDIGNQ